MNLISVLANWPKELVVLLIAMLPVAELRVALPIALKLFNFSIYQAIFWSLLGNIIPPLFILLLIDPLTDFLSQRFKVFRDFFSWLFDRTRKRFYQKHQKFGDLALIIFVAVPLPVTGAWTGALAAWLFGIQFKKALPLIFLGLLVASIIVTILTLGISIIF